MLAWFLVALLGCDPYNEAAQKDTIEAYEAYLAASPSGVGLERATFRLEELMLAKARETRALADYDALLARFPKGVHAEAAHKEREIAMFDQAVDTFTLEAWEAFLAAYPNPKEQRGPFAKKAVEALRYVASGVKLGDVRQREINLANDPAGPLNGWELLMDVTNADQVVEALVFRVFYLGEGGKSLAHADWPLVGKQLEFSSPVVDEWTVPMQPGETRTWTWTTGTLPEGWTKAVRVVPIKVRLAAQAPAE